MRVVHLCFQLHQPFNLRDFDGKLPYFDDEAAFAYTNKNVYQPFFALLERNIQRYRGLRLSLMVSGAWLELAERFDMELIRRLKKLVASGQVELVAEPYYHSLAFFYDENELSYQVRLQREKLQMLLGAQTQVFAMPDFLYNNSIAKWAEEFGFAAMLASASQASLAWHSTNHVYEAVECEYLRLLLRNNALSDALMWGKPEILADAVVDKDKNLEKPMLSVVKFQKMLDLELLRGGLVNIYLDVKCVENLRDLGVIAFFDEFFENWLGDTKNKFATASMACVAEAPSMEVTIPEATSWRDVPSNERDSVESDTKGGLEIVAGLGKKLPANLGSGVQCNFGRKLYALRREILASEDEKLIDDYRHLLLMDYQAKLSVKKLENYQKLLQDLQQRAQAIKKQQAVEISRVYTKKHERGNAVLEEQKMAADDSEVRVKRRAKNETPEQDDNLVAIHFGARSVGPNSSAVHSRQNSEDDNKVEVHRLPGMKRPAAVQPQSTVQPMSSVASKPVSPVASKSAAQPMDVAVSKPMAQPMNAAAPKPTKVIEISDGEDDVVSVDDLPADDVDEMMEWATAKEGKTIEEKKPEKGIRHSIRKVIKKLVIE